MTIAPLWRRLAAMIYDTLLLVALWLTTVALLMMLTGGRLAAADRSLWLLVTEQLALLAVTWGFFAWFWTHGGQTLGMRAWRLRLVDQNGGPVSLAQASRRMLAALLSLATAGLGYFWMLIDRERCTWHDRLSGTRVIVVPKGS
jgi:uncharacterized RDD family membrane protein YckC